MSRRWNRPVWWVVGALVATAGAVVVVRRHAGEPAAPPAGRVARFTTAIDNPFLPLARGRRWVYDETGPGGPVERTVTEVTGETQRIMGIPCVVVRETATADGQVVKDTIDWYAQDDEGNVWNFGEDTKEYHDGRLVGTSASWQAGAHGARPGIAMRARPHVGERYLQEHHPGDAEDIAEVLSINQRVSVPFGFFDGVLVIKDGAASRPGVVEHKFYARGVGLVLAVIVHVGTAYTELVEMTGHRTVPAVGPR